MVQPRWREPSAEQRAAAAVHSIPHSVGFVVTATDPGHGVFSFHVDGAGVAAGLGWGQAGPTIDLAAYPNPPANMLTVHTMLVTIDDDAGDEELAAVKQGIRTLVDEHVERYADCSIFPALNVPRALAGWLKCGCPQAAPDETLAADAPA